MCFTDVCYNKGGREKNCPNIVVIAAESNFLH